MTTVFGRVVWEVRDTGIEQGAFQQGFDVFGRGDVGWETKSQRNELKIATQLYRIRSREVSLVAMGFPPRYGSLTTPRIERIRRS
jgi:hypothetical protein